MLTRYNSDALISTASVSERVCLTLLARVSQSVTRSLALAVLIVRPRALVMQSARSFNTARLTTVALLALIFLSLAPLARADQLRLSDGTTMEVDEAWEDAQGVWYRRGGVTYLVERSRVKEVVKAGQEPTKASGVRVKGAGGASRKNANDAAVVKGVGEAGAKNLEEAKKAEGVEEEVWIYLVGGAKMEVDEANEGADGVWYRRDNISTFLERARVERVERVQLSKEDAAEVAVGGGRRRVWRWTTGSARLDSLIKQNGARYDVDPYLIFCVMEQESHFNSRAVSPAGARGLMQLMPGTAARFGVRNPHDPVQNVSGGTRYLRELLARFSYRVDLVLAGYNAGEGNVTRYGNRVPPFRETRDYVRRITARYEEVK
jgi:Zn-finger nucleic acid-binding protein